MISKIFTAYRAMNDAKRFFLTIIAFVLLILAVFGGKNLYFYFHDKEVIEKHDAKVNHIVKKQVEKDAQKVQDFNDRVDASNVDLLDSLLSKEASEGDPEQERVKTLHEKIPDAGSESQELPGSEANNKLGIENQLHAPPLSGDEITQLLLDEAKNGKEVCYPEEVVNDDGSTGIIEVCSPLSSLLNNN